MRRWGSIYYDRHARRWRARAGDEARTSLGLYPTREAAEEALDEAERFAALQLRASGSTAALVAYGRAWIESERRAGIRRGLDREKRRFERHIATAEFAEWPMAAITRADVQRWVREIAAGKAEGPRGKGQRRSKRTVQKALSLLRVILAQAIEDGIVETSPAEGIKLPREEHLDEELTILSAAEVDLLIAGARIPLMQHTAFVTACMTGMRPGELWGLRWEDVVLGGEPCVMVRHSRGRGTKGGRVRRVPLLEPAREMLARWQRETGARRGLVWPSPRGGHYADGHDMMWSNRLNGRAGRRWMQLGYRWRCGIDTEIPLKDLRHACASHLLRGTWVARGWVGRPLRMEELQQWLGHRSLTTTERHYARLAPGGLMDVVPSVRHLRAVEGEG